MWGYGAAEQGGAFCRNDLQQEVMRRLEHLNALNKECSEYKSMCKILQEQLDQLRSIREVIHVVAS